MKIKSIAAICKKNKNIAIFERYSDDGDILTQYIGDGSAASVSAAQKAIGNGWTAEVIIHLLSYALKGIPKDEEIVVLSMYDGIGTGRYCLEKLGYSNIRYYATEIDKHAIEIAKSNYPDIVECGDAFAVREEEWNIKQFRERVKE